MRIDGNNSAASVLRLIGPQSPSQTAPVEPSSPARRPAPADSYSFDAVYSRNLPIAPLTDAHRRLERIRHELVAAKVDVPIHFEHPGPRSSNPYLPNHLRFGPEPAALNESVTEHAAELLQKKQA